MTKKTEAAVTAYQSAAINRALDEALHPGGLDLTDRLARIAGITSGSRVLDVAAGRGTSAVHLAQGGDCRVHGIDLSLPSLAEARRNARLTPASDRIHFTAADALRLPFAAASFDHVICECALSLLPDKPAGAREMVRVLKTGGRLTMTDFFLSRPLTPALAARTVFCACLAGAMGKAEYVDLFTDAGLSEAYFEDHSRALLRTAFKLQAEFGSLDAFWCRFGGGCDPPAEGARPEPVNWKEVFAWSKPGYGLFSFVKPAPEDK